MLLHLHHQKGTIAQLVEHRIENPCVGGSSPPSPTSKKPNS